LATGAQLVPVVKDSNGGTLSLTGEYMLFTNASLSGGPGGGGNAQGGELDIVSKRGGNSYQPKNGTDTTPQASDPVLILASSAPGFVYNGLGQDVTDKTTGKIYADTNRLGQVWFGADNFTQGNFGTLDLSVKNAGALQVQGDVSLSATRQITIADGGVLSYAPDPNNPLTPHTLSLTAPYVVLGRVFAAPGVTNLPQGNVLPFYGNDTLAVNAVSLIDIGNLALQNIGTANFDATHGGSTNGAIRGDGTLDVAGAINLTAGQIYPPTATTFNITAYDYSSGSGSVTINPGPSMPALPLSGGGTLNIYATNITQGGVLRAPIGTINLGASSSGVIDPLSGKSLPKTSNLTLLPGSITSVSAAGLTIPYGINLNGTSWIDPTGTDITNIGPAAKAINLTATNIDLQAATASQPAASIDLTGGGDLYAYQFVPGTGGKTDILLGSTGTTIPLGSTSFAIIPGYTDTYEPYAPYNNTSSSLISSDPGYTISNYRAGERIHLAGGGGLPAGDYTLLPARYALLPGAYLVTPRTTAMAAGQSLSVTQPDGSTVMAGYGFNNLLDPANVQPWSNSFEIAPQSVVLNRAQYANFSANTFFAGVAANNGTVTPRLPIDSGQLVLNATKSLEFGGTLAATPPAGGRGSLVDITSASDILIATHGTIDPTRLVLDASDLSSLGADSLLIGGVRSFNSAGTAVTVATTNLEVNNAGEPLTGPDIILVANQKLQVDASADVEQKGTLSSPADTLQVGQQFDLINGGFNVANGGVAFSFPQGTNGNNITASVAGIVTSADGKTTTPFNANSAFSVPTGGTVTLNSGGTINGSSASIPLFHGDGTLLRVSSDPSATISRPGVANAVSALNPVAMSIGQGATIGPPGAVGSVTLDSTNLTKLDPTVTLSGKTINLDSGQISLLLPTDPPGSSTPQGLVLTNNALANLTGSATSLSFLSYSTIDIYGTTDGSPSVGSPALAYLALHAGEIRGFNNSGGTASFAAQNISLDNSANSADPGAVAGQGGGALEFDATNTITLGANQLAIDQYNNGVTLNAPGGILVEGTGGLVTQGNLTMVTPLLTGAKGANQTIITNSGALTIQPSTNGSAPAVVGGLGANLTLVGANGVAANSTIQLPSGTMKVEAKSGDVSVGGTIDVSGTEKDFFDQRQFTGGGQITLTADAGKVTLAPGSTVNVSAQPAAGNAGGLTVSAPSGTFSDAGRLLGQGGAGGQGGTFSLDAGSIQGVASGDISSLGNTLSSGDFTQSVSIRDRTDFSVMLDQGKTLKAHSVNLSADAGFIDIAGIIDASGMLNTTQSAPLAGAIDPTGPAGGTINLAAGGNIVLEPTAWLTAAGYCYSDAGKGGAISLSAGSYTGSTSSFNQNAVVNIKLGAQIDLGVPVTNHFTPEDMALNPGVAVPADNRTDLFTGTLQISEPQTAFGNGTTLLNSLGSDLGHINNGSSVVLAGLEVFDLSGNSTGSGSIKPENTANGIITSTVEADVMTNGSNFVSNVYNSNNSFLTNQPEINIEPSAEIVNNNPNTNTGALTLNNTWDLSKFRFGPAVTVIHGSGEPGILTLRAAGNLVFKWTNYVSGTKTLTAGSLSDGFDLSNFTAIPLSTAQDPLWTANLLPTGSRSWSYDLIAGADFGAADSSRVSSLATLNNLGANAGSLLLGSGSPALPATGSPSRATIIPQFFQTIRTGTGDIDISTGRDVQLLNPLATIYTAGQAVANPATVVSTGDFAVPNLSANLNTSQPATPYYPAQYSLAGGNVSIYAQNDIARYVQSGSGLTASSSLEMPTDWLYRRGNLGASGLFASLSSSTIGLVPEIQSTSWWVDFSNFFADIGALGGGNVSLVAGHNVSNVDAAVPTNARMPVGTPNAANLAELGGGDLAVQAGANIDGGVYYTERGNATLQAGGIVTTNSTRAISSSAVANSANWLPTTLFLGQGMVDVTAGGDIRLGPVTNPFWLPQGRGNRLYEKTYFSTFAPSDAVNVSSLDGAVTLTDNPDSSTGASLYNWYTNVLTSTAQPWLASIETVSGTPQSSFGPSTPALFQVVASIMPGTLRATAFSSDINLVGSLTLAPAPDGTIDLLAAGNINGLQPNSDDSGTLHLGSAAIDLSDADPAQLPGVATPLSFATYTSSTPQSLASFTAMSSIDAFFAEAGGTSFSLAQKLALHGQVLNAQGQLVPLHAGDTNPVHLYAAGGDVSGLTFYSAKPAMVVASRDITDIALYLQNTVASNLSEVSAGRDIIAYDPTSSLRLAAAGNGLDFTLGDSGPASANPTAGDIQISGPGTLEVLAGRNLTLGNGNSPTTDGTAAGLTSSGSIDNFFLPQNAGANIVAAAGVGTPYTSAALSSHLAPGLASTSFDFPAFINAFLNPNTADAEASRYLPVLGSFMGLPSGTDDATIWAAFGNTAGESQATLALELYYRVLRDAGRDHNDITSPNFGTYTNGLAAVQALFPGSPTQPTTALPTGSLSMAQREIKTFEGGNISLLVPGGGITVGLPTDPQTPNQGILTQRGGNISIFAADSVNVGTSRIFTLLGGNEIIWSSTGSIAAGSGSKTVHAAPPTRVLIDPTSANVTNDLAGLATGSGIGVLATLVEVVPGDVDLIAPNGTIDAGDAGIRASGNLNISAVQVLNASNIQTGGKSTGTPAPPAAPNVASIASASNTSAASSNAAAEVAKQGHAPVQQEVFPSIITVEVLGYGGGDS
jgi:hypothetical protein